MYDLLPVGSYTFPLSEYVCLMYFVYTHTGTPISSLQYIDCKFHLAEEWLPVRQLSIFS